MKIDNIKEYQLCCKCRKTKPILDFPILKDGRSRTCHVCRVKYKYTNEKGKHKNQASINALTGFNVTPKPKEMVRRKRYDEENRVTLRKQFQKELHEEWEKVRNYVSRFEDRIGKYEETIDIICPKHNIERENGLVCLPCLEELEEK